MTRGNERMKGGVGVWVSKESECVGG